MQVERTLGRPHVHVVLGADIGGTATRVVLAGPDGSVHGAGRAGGGNLRSSRPEDVAAHLTAALRDALAAAGLGVRIDAAHLGIAGAGDAGTAAARSVVARAWADAGAPEPSVPVVVGDDLEIAFASAAHGVDGLLLLAGTGAVAGRIQGGRVVARCDGMGWLLGDEGSAVWLGLGALRAVAADLDGRGPATALTAAVLDALGVAGATGQDPRQALIGAAYGAAPSTYGRLAPLVTAAAGAGDATARTLVAAGAAALLRTAARAASRVDDAPAEVVVAGALLTADGSLRDAVLPGLRAAYGAPVREAVAPVAGAVALAAAHAGWVRLDLSRVAGWG